jgi:hypothetical protein
MRPLTRRKLLNGLVHGAVGTALTGAAASGPTRRVEAQVPPHRLDLMFRALWGNKQIGTHRIAVMPETESGNWRVEVAMDIKVSLGWFGEITFKHHCQEVWQDGRIVELTSTTDDDGDVFNVNGEARGADFALQGPSGPFLAPANLLTSSSAWSEAVCRQDQLIDATHGSVIGVVADLKGERQVETVRGRLRARRYDFVSPLLSGELLYGTEGEWIGGQLHRKGQKIDYVLRA